MKIKLLILGLGAAALSMVGCDDDLNLVGSSIQPDSDKIAVFTDTFMMTSSTVKVDSIFARSVTGLLGEFYDPLYGNLKSDYICQFYCPENYKFTHTPIDGAIDSVDFRITYYSSIGDTLTPMHVQIYNVTTPLTKNYYTNMNPANYSDMKTSLGMQTYTAYDATVSDSIRAITDTEDDNYYVPHITVRLSKSIGQNFYNETITNPASFKNQESFNKFFPGLYVTTTFGSGNILNVANSTFSIYYKYMATVKGSAGQDSSFVARGVERFNVTKEVIQLNRIKNSGIETLLQPNDEYSYLKSPAGVFTRLTIPAAEIIKKVNGHIINNMPLTLKALPQESWKYALAPPTNLLLIPEDSVSTFFEDGRIEDNLTSFLSTDYSFSTRQYSFSNISALLKNQIEKNPDKDLNLLVIPVERVKGSYGSSYYSSSTTYYTISLNHYLAPSGVKLRKDAESMKLQVISSKYNQ